MNNSKHEITVAEVDVIGALLDEADASFFRMGRLMMSRQSDFVRENGLTTPQFMVLRMLQSESGMRVSDIAASLGVKSPAASMLVQTLEDQGFVTRTHDSDDHRVVLVSPTTLGEEQLLACERSRRDFMRKLTTDLTEDDLRAFVRIITTLADTMAQDV